tara:strand:- start:4651 stop:5487 length:837 start_codon:yes stop_codon:yes gene_type:complete
MNQEFFDDCMQGLAWEEKWREPVEEHRMLDVLAFKASKIPLPEELTPVETAGWPEGRVGLGTFKWKYGPEIIEGAIGAGLAMIDTAEGYGFGRVEEAIGGVIKRVGTGGTWIASKVSRNHLSHTATLSAGRRSRNKLNVESIDLYQVHWPNPDKPIERTLDAMAELIDEGTIKRVGVCNFSHFQLVAAMKAARERGFEIESNQIRLNYQDQSALRWLVPACRTLGVRVIAHSPLGQGALKKSAMKALGWLLERGVYVIPRTNSVDHLRDIIGLLEYPC